MNAKQETYATLKALYETLTAQMAAGMKQHEALLNTDEGIEEYYNIEEQFDIQLGVTKAKNALLKAENEMIAWSKGVMERKHAAQFKQVAWLYESKCLDVHQKLVDLSFRLAA